MKYYIILTVLSFSINQALPPDILGKYQGAQDKFIYEVNNQTTEMPKTDWEMVVSSVGIDFTQISEYGTFNYSGNYKMSENSADKNLIANVREEKSGGEYNFELTLLFKELKPYWVMKTADKIPEIILLKVEEVFAIPDLTMPEEGLETNSIGQDGGKGEVFAFCPSCGFPNKNKFVYCPRCGSDLVMETGKSGTHSEDESSAPVSDLESFMVDTPVEAQQVDDIPIEIGKLVQPKKISGQYTIQVASKPTIHEARGVQDNLIDNGFNSYLQEVKFSDNNDIWYRIRVGKYRKKDRAVSTRNKVATIYGNDVWVDNVRMDID